MLKRFFLNLKELFDGSVVSLTKKEYSLPVHYLWILMRSLVFISDEWLNAVCWTSLLLGIFMIKKWVVFSLTSCATLKYDCVIKIREIFNFLPLINNSITTGFNLLLRIISAMISSKTINILHSLSILYSPIVLWTLCTSFEHSIKALASLKCFSPLSYLLLIKKWYLAS